MAMKFSLDFEISVDHSNAAQSRLKRDDFASNRHRALACCLRMIFSENRYTLFRIML
jgi:hypothetical protein